ncbi:MAG TPA: molybdopterin cofactor-binding domain-containing protein [Anaeromyxobacteraceae bacterium]|nr:molybdopterin cofactor-binding domain-containing protein [Anaeromyxobacteraceae bacterium]
MADPSESSAARAGAPPPSRPAPASAPQAGTAFGAVGKPLRRADGRAKVTGETRFADDLSLPGMLFMKLKRSSVPHARILEVDAAAALAVPGVRAVLTGRDFPVRYGILPVSQDEHALCVDKVRFVGDPVAAVVAADELVAEEAARLVAVRYQPLATIASPEEALATPEPRIHEYGDGGNVHKAVALDFGDVPAALASADQVFEDLFFYQGSTHLALEQHATLAYLDADGRLTIATSTQVPHYLHRAAAKVLGVPPARLRVIAQPQGGGFGGKTDLFNHEIVAAKAALVTGRPVKVSLTREEVFACHRGRHPVLMRLRTGVGRDGRILGHSVETLLDGGAYGGYGVASTFYTGALETVTYRMDRYRFRGCRTFTNKPPCGPKRGHGTPQPRFGLEVHLDKICQKLGRDPAEWRIQNALAAGSLTANWMKVRTIGLVGCLEAVVAASRWKERRGKLGPGRGLGLASSAYLCGAGLPIYFNDMPHSGVQLLLDRGGGVTVFCGAAEVGQGSDTVLAVLVAEVLGLDPDDVKLVTGDTALGPVDLGSYSSRVTLMMGNAAVEAAGRARDRLAAAAAQALEVPLERVGFGGGRVFDVGDPDRAITFAEAVQRAEAEGGTVGTVGSYRPPPPPSRYKGGGVGPSPAYSYTAAVVEVEVDAATGVVRVVKVWIAHDIGRALNPVLVRGQVEGSVYMGLGEALMEEQEFVRLPPRLSRALVHQAPSMLEYKSPATVDMPEVETILVDGPEPNGPFGAKEVGQGPLLPIPPAVANAVHDAVGVRVDEVPITPEKVLAALKAGSRRHGPEAFPSIAWPEPLMVPPPWEGGDGSAVNEPRRSEQRGRRPPEAAKP